MSRALFFKILTNFQFFFRAPPSSYESAASVSISRPPAQSSPHYQHQVPSSQQQTYQQQQPQQQPQRQHPQVCLQEPPCFYLFTLAWLQLWRIIIGYTKLVVDFCLKVTRFKGNFDTFWNGGVRSWQKLFKIWSYQKMSAVKVVLIIQYFNFNNKTIFRKIKSIFETE